MAEVDYLPVLNCYIKLIYEKESFMKNNTSQSSKNGNVSKNNQTSSISSDNKASNKTNHMKANPDKRDGPGGE